jgi:Glyoxalase/Bleomycin resistance protein/Dioxygenase superfamily
VKTTSPYHHIGYVVPDLSVALKDFGAFLRVDWTPITEKVRTVRSEGDEQVLTFKVAYSVQGPPKIEVIEGIVGTLWQADDGPRMHHIGVRMMNVDAESKRLRDMGMKQLAAGLHDDGRVRWAFHPSPAGGLVELSSG